MAAGDGPDLIMLGTRTSNSTSEAIRSCCNRAGSRHGMGMVAPAIPRASRQTLAQWLAWLPIIAGLMVLYLPSFLDLFRTIWATDEQKHGPIVLSVAWLT